MYIEYILNAINILTMRQSHIITKDKLPEPLNVLGETVTVLAAGDTTKPFEVHVQEGVEGGGPPLHSHPWDEAFYILEGEVEMDSNYALEPEEVAIGYVLTCQSHPRTKKVVVSYDE